MSQVFIYFMWVITIHFHRHLYQFNYLFSLFLTIDLSKCVPLTLLTNLKFHSSRVNIISAIIYKPACWQSSMMTLLFTVRTYKTMNRPGHFREILLQIFLKCYGLMYWFWKSWHFNFSIIFTYIFLRIISSQIKNSKTLNLRAVIERF